MKTPKARLAWLLLPLPFAAGCSNPGGPEPEARSTTVEVVAEGVRYGLGAVPTVREKVILLRSDSHQRVTPLNLVAEELGLGSDDRDAVIVCPDDDPGSMARCSMPEGVVLVSYGRERISGSSATIEVTYWESAGRSRGVHMRWYLLELKRESDGWEVARVLGRGAS